MRGKRTELTGRRFGRLLVAETAGSRQVTPKCAEALWRCRCDCGNEVVKPAKMLLRGRLKSCGCLHEPHGHNRKGKRTRTYRIWVNMLTRCFNEKVTSHKDYGGRGITVCYRWWTFKNFLTDMGECPPDLMIDRIDNNGNYEPSNCRWATLIEQANNKRNTQYVTFRGEAMSMVRLASLAGLPYYVVQQRISRYGWTPEQAATTPVGATR